LYLFLLLSAVALEKFLASKPQERLALRLFRFTRLFGCHASNQAHSADAILFAPSGLVLFNAMAFWSRMRSLLNPGSLAIQSFDRLETWIAVVGYAIVLNAMVTLLLSAWTSMRY